MADTESRAARKAEMARKHLVIAREKKKLQTHTVHPRKPTVNAPDPSPSTQPSVTPPVKPNYENPFLSPAVQDVLSTIPVRDPPPGPKPFPYTPMYNLPPAEPVPQEPKSILKPRKKATVHFADEEDEDTTMGEEEDESTEESEDYGRTRLGMKLTDPTKTIRPLKRARDGDEIDIPTKRRQTFAHHSNETDPMWGSAKLNNPNDPDYDPGYRIDPLTSKPYLPGRLPPGEMSRMVAKVGGGIAVFLLSLGFRHFLQWGMDKAITSVTTPKPAKPYEPTMNQTNPTEPEKKMPVPEYRLS